MARTIAGAAPGRTNRRFLIIAVLLAGLSAALVYAITARDSGGSESSGSIGSTQVVVARTAIKQRTAISAEMLELKSVPTNAVITGAYVSVNDAIGKVTKFPVEANQQLTQSAVVDTSRPASSDALALVVPTNKRAMSIEASQVNNAGGLILPGDYVDLVWWCCDDNPVITKTIARNVQVVAVAQAIVSSGPVDAEDPSAAPVGAGDEKPEPEADTMTLLVSLEEAQDIFLAEGNGRIRAALRGVGDTELPDPGIAYITDILPLEALNVLPDELKPDGYKPEGR